MVPIHSAAVMLLECYHTPSSEVRGLCTLTLMPNEVLPAATALRAYSICTSLPLGLKVVKEKEYCKTTHRSHLEVHTDQRIAMCV